MESAKCIVMIQKIGRSLGFVIPKRIVKKLNLKAGEKIELTLSKIPKSMFGSLKGKLEPMIKEDRWHDHE